MYVVHSLLNVLIMFGIPVGGTLGAYLLMRRWAASGRLCGKCGLLVGSADALHCPGCGSDYRVAGIKARNMPVQRLTALFVLAWFIIGSFAAAETYSIVRRSLPVVHEISATLNLTSPESRAYYVVRVTPVLRLRTGWFDGPVKPTQKHWTVEFSSGNQIVASVSVDELARSYTLRHAESATHHRGPINTQLLADWLGGVFPEANSSSLHAEADEIIDYVDQLLGADADLILNQWRSGRGIHWRFGRTGRSAFAGMTVDLNPSADGWFLQYARWYVFIMLWWLPAIFIVLIGRFVMRRQITASDRRAIALKGGA